MGFNCLTSQMGYNLPVFSGPLGGSIERREEEVLWEMVAPSGPALAPAQPWVGGGPGWGVPLNSQVIPEAGLARPRSSSIKWTSLMVPKALSHLYEKRILAKGNGDFLPQYPCM